MFDRNPSFLHALPSPIVSLATVQMAGRGRGGNAWLSTCRVFANVAQGPTILPTNLVFIQYLYALAIIDTCHILDPASEWAHKVRMSDALTNHLSHPSTALLNIHFDTYDTASLEITFPTTGIVGVDARSRGEFKVTRTPDGGIGRHPGPITSVVRADFWQLRRESCGRLLSFLSLLAGKLLPNLKFVSLTDGQDVKLDLTGGYYDVGGYDLANQTPYLDGMLRCSLDWLSHESTRCQQYLVRPDS
ncbi:uncharacterized protein BJ212DRAFT_1303916 [Suillus subaureus]|uniref:BPL/LPL catalytic domain-containing protein n=1 Tax=Suillus subaureus TaxID=48587 RepID=A0A9P7J706_9AGAM|nr:uncharacterized protein BJ212DRAFT_1303916 [Suillus subaureus]KAG1805859.1 hypothetical protein BJ212DRAFT_1303916 [Suillus subaureus]